MQYPSLNGRSVKYGGVAVGPHPPQFFPILGTVVEQDGDSRVRCDVVDSAKRASRLGLVVHGKDDEIADGGVDDWHRVWMPVDPDSGQGGKPGGGRQRTPFPGQLSRNSLRRILPEADFGIASRNSTTRTFL